MVGEKKVMQAVYKYGPIPIDIGYAIAMPRNAEILTGGLQSEQAFIWALVDPDALNITRHFRIIGTGWEFNSPDELNKTHKYITTMQTTAGYVWHVFEIV